jgi:hypothetical protein
VTPLPRALRWLPVALLAGVAVMHFALVRCCSLHPWLGGGFGMFSTVDERRLLAFRIGAGGEQPLELPYELEDAAERAEALPREARVRAVAEALAAQQPGAQAVRVEVWEMRFGPEMERQPQRLRAVRVEVAPGGS